MRGSSRAGFTLVELLLALGLFAILVLALVRLLDTSLTIWGRTEERRDLFEVSTAVAELFASDLQSLEAGPRGDFLGEWVAFDLDGDGVRNAFYPRLRFVRQASAAELLRLAPGTAVDPRALGRLETVWALLPSGAEDPDGRSAGVLWRGQRVVGGEGLSFFDPDFFTASGRPAAGALEEVCGGVLWCSLWYATQTTILEDGWRLGDTLADCAASWDAWGRGRPDGELSEWNRPGRGMPAAGDLPLLPRRVRLELELERPSELSRRTRLARGLDPESDVVYVRDERRLPPPGTMLLVDEEWLLLQAVDGPRLTVQRGRRGSQAVAHDAGALLHHGDRVLREIPIPLHREDWNL